MSKLCIFNNNKACNNCGECDRCELNCNKTCDNCGKCLQLQGYDVKAIKIDEVFEETNKSEDKEENKKADVELNEELVGEFSDFMDEEQEENSEDNSNDILQEDEKYIDSTDEDYIDALDNEENWEYIEDIEDVKLMLQEKEGFDDYVHEQFPGLIVMGRKDQ